MLQDSGEKEDSSLLLTPIGMEAGKCSPAMCPGRKEEWICRTTHQFLLYIPRNRSFERLVQDLYKKKSTALLKNIWEDLNERNNISVNGCIDLNVMEILGLPKLVYKSEVVSVSIPRGFFHGIVQNKCLELLWKSKRPRP